MVQSADLSKVDGILLLVVAELSQSVGRVISGEGSATYEYDLDAGEKFPRDQVDSRDLITSKKID